MRAAIRRLRLLFAGFARAVHDLGAFGNGSRMKYVANLLVAINNVASAEAMVLGLKAGLDAQTMFDATVPIYDKAMRGGHAAHDTAAVCAVLEKMAGVKRKTRQRAKRP